MASAASAPAPHVAGPDVLDFEGDAPAGVGLEALLRGLTTRVSADPETERAYRAATRPLRHRTCRVWLAVILATLLVNMPLSLVATGGEHLRPMLADFGLIWLCFAVAIVRLPSCRSALAEDAMLLLPCLALIVGGSIGCAQGGPVEYDRHIGFQDVTICSAMIFLSGGPRLHAVLLCAAVPAMWLAGLASGTSWTALVEDGGFWTVSLFGFSWAGRMQERGRFRLFLHRVEREGQLRRVSAISDTLFRGARTDALTRVGNRLLLDERLAELANSGEPLRDLWLLMVDVDHFKQLNDALGHPAGDECLRRIAATLASCLRQDDMLARYGGEEFVALIRAPEAIHAWRVAERMREQVAGLPLANPRTEAGHVTVSIGLAAIGPGGVSSVIARADMALYAAKGAGRDRVAIEPGFERTGYPMPGMAIPTL